jgi:hypothetical protein
MLAARGEELPALLAFPELCHRSMIAKAIWLLCEGYPRLAWYGRKNRLAAEGSNSASGLSHTASPLRSSVTPSHTSGPVIGSPRTAVIPRPRLVLQNIWFGSRCGLLVKWQRAELAALFLFWLSCDMQYETDLWAEFVSEVVRELDVLPGRGADRRMAVTRRQCGLELLAHLVGPAQADDSGRRGTSCILKQAPVRRRMPVPRGSGSLPAGGRFSGSWQGPRSAKCSSGSPASCSWWPAPTCMTLPATAPAAEA